MVYKPQTQWLLQYFIFNIIYTNIAAGNFSFILQTCFIYQYCYSDGSSLLNLHYQKYISQDLSV